MKQYIIKFKSSIVANYLSKGYVGAIAIGRSEAGPRALGNRSILAYPRVSKHKDRINGLIKNRDAYQPLAPICLEEDFDRFFIKPKANVLLDYMQYAIKCKDNTIIEIPAIVHSDMTARVQIITKNNHYILHDILTSFKNITNIGILINTSFNGKNEPIVNTVTEAYSAYKELGLDFIVIDEYIITSIL